MSNSKESSVLRVAHVTNGCVEFMNSILQAVRLKELEEIDNAIIILDTFNPILESYEAEKVVIKDKYAEKRFEPGKGGSKKKGAYKEVIPSDKEEDFENEFVANVNTVIDLVLPFGAMQFLDKLMTEMFTRLESQKEGVAGSRHLKLYHEARTRIPEHELYTATAKEAKESAAESKEEEAAA